MPLLTYNDIYLQTRRTLRDGGVAAYDLEARLIVEFASGKTRETYVRTARMFPPDGKFESAVLEYIARRLGGEPIAYITGEWEFYSLPMKVTADTLIPRADTEILAERAITLLRGGTSTAPRVLDMCCGTGCVGLAIAYNVPSARVVLADNSETVLAVARENITRNALTRRVMAQLMDARETPPPLFGPFDMIVCNPPYIPSADIERLDVSVRDYEPRAALDGGEDGLEYFRDAARLWKSALTAGGMMLFEVGVSQSGAVCDIMRTVGFTEVLTTPDLQGVQRVVEGRG